MDKGIKTILCTTMVFALVAGLISGCNAANKENAASGSAGETSSTGDISITVPVVTAEGTTVSSSYRSVKDNYNGVLPDKGVAGDYEFELYKPDSFGVMTKERGYYVDTLDEPNAPYFIVICSGEKNTGGYGIKITDLGFQDDKFLITVEETSPAEGDVVTQAFTCPFCVLKLDKMPARFLVINTNGQVFPDVYSDDEDISDGNGDIDPRTLEKDYKLPDGWIASFRNGAGEIMNETFIYKEGTGYKYINVVAMTESWGSTKWNNHFRSEGTCGTKEEVIKAAEKFGSAGFMVLPDDLTKTHSVEDFIKMDL